jgi:hypothetical protein
MTVPNGNNVKDWTIRNQTPKKININQKLFKIYYGVGSTTKC